MLKKSIKEKKRWFSKIGISIALISIALPFLSDSDAQAGDYYTQDVQFYNLSSPNGYRTVTIPTHDFVNSVTTDTGNVSYTESGNNINLSVSGSPINGSAWDNYLYSTYASSSASSYNPNSFDNYISYSSGSYSGSLSKSGTPYVSSGIFEARRTKEIVDNKTASYTDSDGYYGTLTARVISGKEVTADSKEVTAYKPSGYTQQDYIDNTTYDYSVSSYAGTLKRQVDSGEYTKADSINVPDWATAAYSKNGYTGTLKKAGTHKVQDGTKTFSKAKASQTIFSGVHCSDGYDWDSKSSTWKDAKGGAKFDLTLAYNSGGYSGTLDYVPDDIARVPQSACTSEKPKGSPVNGITTRYMDGTGSKAYYGTVYSYKNVAYYSGTAKKPASDTRKFSYSGTAKRPYSDTRKYLYDGTVVRNEVDTRIYTQSYTGYIYMGGYYDTYTYNVKIGYTVNSAPTIDVNDASTADYFRGQSLSYGGTFKDSDTQDTVTIKWSLDNGATQTVGSYKATNKDQPFNFNYTLPSDTSTGTHTVRIWAEDNSNLSNKSSVVSKTFTVNPFSTPYSPSYSNVTNNSFNIAFNKGDNISSTTYELYDVTNSQTHDLGTSNSYSESDVSPNTLHTYKVRSYNKIGEYSSYSSATSIYTLANAPTGGSVDDSTYTLNNGTAKLDWNGNGNTSDTKYHYEIRNKSTNDLIKSGDVNTTNATVTGLPTDVRYTVTVNAINGNGLETSKITIGEIFQDAIKPVANYSLSTTAWINGDVTISYSVTDSGTGVKNVTYPDGSVKTTTSGTFVATKNGTYTFTAVDNAGNKTVTDVKISNIDKTAPNKPSMEIFNVPNSDTEVYITFSDNGDGDGSGVRKYEYRMDGSAWKVYTPGSKVDVPSNRTGLIPVEARVTDGVGLVSDILLDYAIIDTTPPEIHSYGITDDDGDGKYIFHVDATDDVGLVEEAGYMYYKKLVGVDKDFVILNQDNGKNGWVGDEFINVPNTPSSSLYIYKATVRDYKNHQVSTKEIPYLTAPIFTYSGIKESGPSNTATFELNNAVGKDVTVKVYREGNFVANIVSGNKFVDVGLNYDREYKYEFVSETTVDGKVVESDTVKKTIFVKKPLIEATLDSENTYKTPFTDEFSINGRVAYQKGGKVSFVLSEKGNQVGTTAIDVDAFATHDWTIKGMQTDDNKHTYDILADLVGYEDTEVYKREYKVTVSKKDVTVQDVQDSAKFNMYE